MNGPFIVWTWPCIAMNGPFIVWTWPCIAMNGPFIAWTGRSSRDMARHRAECSVRMRLRKARRFALFKSLRKRHPPVMRRFALLALLALAACHERTDVYPNAPVILISVDTLRSDHL